MTDSDSLASGDLITDFLILDQMSVLLELAIERGFSDLVCFLAEADRIRLTDAHSATIIWQDRTMRYLDRIEHTLPLNESTSLSQLRSMLALRMPFPTMFASVCDKVYNIIQQQVRTLPVSLVVRRIVPNVDELKPELSSVLRANIYREHYEAFLSLNRPVDVNVLKCWEEVDILLQSVQGYVLPSPSVASESAAAKFSSNSASSTFTASTVNEAKRHSMVASKGAVDALLTGSGGTVIAASASYLLGETLSDPIRVFSLLLVSMRQFQRRFFSVSTSISPILSVAGISDAIRMELATTLEMTSSVRSNDIESVDSAFAAACAGRLVRLLRSIERETFQYLQLYFPSYVHSDEYYLSLIATRARASSALEQYTSSSIFLECTVSSERVINWTNPDAFGKTFVFCDKNDTDPDTSLPPQATGILIRGPVGNASPSLCKLWSVSGVTCKLANPFSLKQESLRSVIKDVWVEAMSQIGEKNEEEVIGKTSSRDYCISFSLGLHIPLALSLLSLFPSPSTEQIEKSNRNFYLSIAVTCQQVGQIGIACALCEPPATPLIEGLRQSSLWALRPDGDCLKFDCAMCQSVLRDPVVPIQDIYGLAQEPHKKYMGVCDIAISSVVESLGTRLTIQILLMLLTNRSVLLLSRSSSHLSRLLAVIPRLAWPFALHKTHKTASFSDTYEFEKWVAGELKPNIGLGSWLVSATTTIYDSSSNETKRTMVAMQGVGSAGSSHTGLFIFNADSCLLANPPGLASNQNFSKLTDPSILNRLNSGPYRTLKQSIQCAKTNSSCEGAFSKYLVDIFLRYLPPSVFHYPKHRVIGCDVKQLLSDLPRPQTNGAHGGTGPGGCSDVEIEFVTELVGLTSPALLQLLRQHQILFSL